MGPISSNKRSVWCSAVVLYERETQTIFASAICFSSGRICYARADQKKAYWYVEGGDPVLFRGCSDIKSLDEARVAFFGQKAKNLAWLSSNKMLTDFLARVEPALSSPAAPDGPQMEDKTAFRLYNFAGNAVIAQMADRHKRGRRFIAGVDAVFESFGQKPHDFVPGAFIAKRCGANLQDLAGKEITYADLDAMIANPTHRGQPYVIAATDELATAVRKLVRAR